MRAFLFSGGCFGLWPDRAGNQLAILAARMFLLIGSVFGFSSVADATEFRAISGPGRTSLIELFSSEGCSSCPPAERWLGELRSASGLWRDFVPVAFHVDYWNRLGWTDRFSTRDFTQRQYALANVWGGESVYTPCFVRDGTEWRPPKSTSAGDPTPVGVLSIVIGDDSTCRVEFPPVNHERSLEAHVALLGGGFLSKVTAGENRGESLPQEFVALALADHELIAENASHRAEFPMPRSKITDAPRRAVAVWVTRRGELAPLQATGGWWK